MYPCKVIHLESSIVVLVLNIYQGIQEVHNLVWYDVDLLDSEVSMAYRLNQDISAYSPRQ